MTNDKLLAFRVQLKIFTRFTKLPSILRFSKKLLPTIFNSNVLIANSEKYTLADCALSINDYSKRDEVCTSINFNIRVWYEVEISLSDNPRQKETIDGIIWLRRKKCVIYRLDIIFSITHVAQLMVSKINFFSKGALVDICRGISEEGY